MTHPTDELVPCPFCGLPAEIEAGIVGCPDIDCPAFLLVDNYVEEHAAIAEWNTRTLSTPPFPVTAEEAQAALDAFEAVLDDYNHGIYGNRTYQDSKRDIEKVRAVLQAAAGVK